MSLACFSAAAQAHFYTDENGIVFFFHFSDTKPRVTILKNPDHDEIYTEDLISLSCHVNISSGWKFQWFKENHPLAESASDHTVASAVTGNSGLYKCKVKRGSGILLESVSPLAKLDVKGVCVYL